MKDGVVDFQRLVCVHECMCGRAGISGSMLGCKVLLRTIRMLLSLKLHTHCILSGWFVGNCRYVKYLRSSVNYTEA